MATIVPLAPTELRRLTALPRLRAGDPATRSDARTHRMSSTNGRGAVSASIVQANRTRFDHTLIPVQPAEPDSHAAPNGTALIPKEADVTEALAADDIWRVLMRVAPSADIAAWTVTPAAYLVTTPTTEALDRVEATTTDGGSFSVFVKTL